MLDLSRLTVRGRISPFFLSCIKRPIVQGAAERDCRKTGFVESLSCPESHRGPGSRVAGGLTDVLLCQGSVERPKGVDLADVVDHRKQPPLYIHFQLGP